jgi:hypothetical protein
MDFEDFPGGWMFFNQATGGNSFEEPQAGRRSARLTLPSGGGRASHNLIGMTPRAETITFWARSKGKNSNTPMMICLHDDGGNQTQTFNYEVTLTQDWKPHVLRIVDFKPYNQAAKGNTIQPGRIRQFSIEGAYGGQLLEMQFDSLRVEAPRSGR